MNQLLQQPFFQMTLPLMVTFVAAIWIASWSQNKRFDDIHRRLDEIIKRLDRIEQKLDDHETRITRVEARTSPIGRRQRSTQPGAKPGSLVATSHDHYR